jgi:hypothetical protein
LTVSRFTPDSTAGRAHNSVIALGGPEPLGAAAIGLTLRDTIYQATGIPQTEVDGQHPAWLDRAGLLETGWEEGDPNLTAPFLRPPPNLGPNSFSANLILDSSVVSSGCRALVSQIQLTPAAIAPIPDGSCMHADAPVAASLDILGLYGPAFDVARNSGESNAVDGAGCLKTLNASTAAMMASRFPVVTPSGVLGECRSLPSTQLIDGGYTEGSGLGAIADLAPQWMQLVRKFNEQHKNEHILVVPYLIYIDNGSATAFPDPTRGNTSEIIVPIVGKLHRGQTLEDTPSLLQRLKLQILPENLTSDPEALTAIAVARPDTVAVVDQTVSPSDSPPLGWALSGISGNTMNRALYTSACTTVSDPTANNRSYATLSSAMALIGTKKPDCRTSP